jgi:hypothetical protein
MNMKNRSLSALFLLTLAASGPGLFGQSFPYGRQAQAVQQVPPMPRTWNEGLGSWASLGLGPSGFVGAATREFERTAVTLRTGIYAWSEKYSGVDLAATIGLPLSRGRLFASVGAGAGLMIGKITGGVDEDLKVKAYPCLAADLQLSLRLTSRLGLGLYAPISASAKRTVMGLFACLQFGRWDPR